MAQFSLPKNSRMTEGKAWPKPAGATRLQEFRIYRWNPDDGANPRIDTYHIDRDDCGPSARLVEIETLTERGWQQLVSINDAINTSVMPITDQDLYRVTEYWTYPSGSGDCEDFALEKRRQLIANGWSPSALLMTVVRQQNGEGHAVLMVRTDRGDLVLDNQVGQILVWKDTSYQFIKRQSQTDSRKWVGIDDTRIITASVRR